MVRHTAPSERNVSAIVWHEGPVVEWLKLTGNFVTGPVAAVEDLIQSPFESIIVLAEAARPGQKLIDFYGLEIMRQLRAGYRLLCPITICSFMPDSFFADHPGGVGRSGRFNYVHQFLKSPGHYFLRLPQRGLDLFDVRGRSITEDELDVCLTGLCKAQGPFSELKRLIGGPGHPSGFTRALGSLSSLLSRMVTGDVAAAENYLLQSRAALRSIRADLRMAAICLQNFDNRPDGAPRGQPALIESLSNALSVDSLLLGLIDCAGNIDRLLVLLDHAQVSSAISSLDQIAKALQQLNLNIGD